MSRYVSLWANEDFRALFAEGGLAERMVSDARRKLESPAEGHDAHAIGFERGQIHALRRLETLVRELAKKEQTETSEEARTPRPSDRQRPRRIH